MEIDCAASCGKPIKANDEIALVAFGVISEYQIRKAVRAGRVSVTSDGHNARFYHLSCFRRITEALVELGKLESALDELVEATDDYQD